MSAEIRSHLTQLFTAALAKVAPQQPATIIDFERPKQATFGDYSCASAMQLTRLLKRAPQKIAQELIDALPSSEWVERMEVAGPGFINIYLRPEAKQNVVRTILRAGEAYGQSNRGMGNKVIVEFVSANPTGPLHVGHGRQAALGEAIAAMLASQGWDVTREFYYNDAGQQIANLAASVRARALEARGEPVEFPEDGYHGEYVREIAAQFVTADGNPDDLEAVRKFAVAALRREQDEDLRAFGVVFDNYFLESSLYADGRVAAVVESLAATGTTYEHDGALWLKTTEFGDDKDRVMRKSDGSYTYFVPDVAYHVTKWERSYKRAVNVQGSDHHSTVTRVRAGLQALSMGIPPGYPDYVLHKMVTVMKGGEEVKISKRAGSYVTLRELIDEVGRDAVRFFLVSRRADGEFAFDVDLAKSQTEDNPVYYVQYAHARVCSVLEQWQAQYPDDARDPESADLAPLDSPRELHLMQRLGDFPDILETAAREYAPHQIAFYLRELAGEFHSYYNSDRILVPETPTRLGRAALIVATRQVLRNGLGLLGVTAPEKM
ncbi:MAG: arginine--tRNA ligase [Burkholderiales bacterium]